MSKPGFWGRLFGRSKAADAAPSAALARTGDRSFVFDGARYGANDGLMNVAAGLGTERDKRAWSFYGTPYILTQYDLESAFRGSWLAGRIVTTPAEDMTREWVSFNWEGYDDAENDVQTLETEESRLETQAKTKEALDWSRLYGGSSILMVMRGDTLDRLALPLDPKTVGKGDLLALQVLDRWQCSALPEIDNDPASPNFRNPLYYMIGDSVSSHSRIHWSRLIRFDGRKLPRNLWLQNGRWHDSELQHVVDTIKDYDGTKAGIAAMVWDANTDIMKIGGLSDALMSADGEQEVIKRLLAGLMMKSFNKALVIDKDNEDYDKKPGNFAGLVEVLREFMADVSGASEIPMVKLFGLSAPGMNSTGENDLRMYYDKIKALQTSRLRPQLGRLFEVEIRSALGKMPKNFKFDFKPLWQQPAKEKAEIQKLEAERDIGYVREGILTEEMVIRDLKDRGTYRTLEDKDVKLIGAQAEQEDKLREMAMKRGAQLQVPGKPGGAGGPGGQQPPPPAK